MGHKVTARTLEEMLRFVDDHGDHKIETLEVDDVVGFYDNDELLCSEYTVNALIALLEDYDGDASEFYRLLRQDAIDRGLPTRLDLVEIFPHNKSERKFSDSYFNTYREYESCMVWDDDDDGLVVVLNTKNGKEAVYERLGCVYCLADRWCIYECVDMPNPNSPYFKHDETIRDMLEQEAIDAGFPMECPV